MFLDSKKDFLYAKRGKAVPGLSVKLVKHHLDREEYYKRKASMEQNPDTKERMSIFKEIYKLLDYGLSKNETLQIITEKFQDSKYTDFFKSWIEDQYKKRGKKLTNNLKKEKSDIER